MRADWVRAAVACVDAGYDIVYAYGAHTYLLGQFLSPFYNRRTDADGGSLENRARLWLEILGDIRAAVGDRAAIAVRVGVGLAPGVETDEVLGFVRLADDLVDLWDVNVGAISDWSADAGPSRLYRSGYQPGACARRPRSRSSASAVSPIPTRWQRSSPQVSGI